MVIVSKILIRYSKLISTIIDCSVSDLQEPSEKQRSLEQSYHVHIPQMIIQLTNDIILVT